jgi:hypothetical protein
MQTPGSVWFGLAFLTVVIVGLALRLWWLRASARRGAPIRAPAAPLGTLQAYAAALVGVTVGLLAWHVLFDRRAPGLQELSYYVIALIVASPIARRWQRGFRDWLTRS